MEGEGSQDPFLAQRLSRVGSTPFQPISMGRRPELLHLLAAKKLKAPVPALC